MKYRPSKKLKSGMLCQMHGKWLVPARSCVRVAGIWKEAQRCQMMTPDGAVISINTPAGLVFQGECTALASSGK